MRPVWMAVAAAAAWGAAATVSAQSWDETDVDEVLELLARDPAAGLARIEELAAGGDPDALNLLAVVLRPPADGVPAPGITPDPERAHALLVQAAAGGSDAARVNLASEYLTNADLDDDAGAVALLREVNPEGPLVGTVAYLLGRALLFGHGVDQDMAAGSELLIQVAEADPDNVDALFLAARSLHQGWGRRPDPGRAFPMMRRAADFGVPRAQWWVGMMLLNGEGVAANPEAAYVYVRSAGEAGDLDGQISTAVMLALGQGTAVDGAEARRWYRGAAESGSAHALRGWGMMLLTGEGGPAEPERGAPPTWPWPPKLGTN